MKRIIMLVAASLMAMVLGACGENAPKKPDEVKPETTVVVEHHDAQEAAPATEAAPVTEEAPTTTEEAPVTNNDAPTSEQ